MRAPWLFRFALPLLGLSCSSAHPQAKPLAEPGDVAGAGGAQGGGGGQAGAGGSAGAHINVKPSGACGTTTIDAHQDPVNLFFVLDRSGSMSEVIGGKRKYDSVRAAVVTLVRSIGFRARVSATLFPSPFTNSCAGGKELFHLTAGDPKPPSSEPAQNGPVTQLFAKSIDYAPGGGTPTALTLASMQAELTKAGKNTFVVLATDGGPNCDGNAACGADQCTLNIENVPGCTPSVNCCDPQVNPQASPLDCLDGQATVSSVTALAASGIKTLVIGIPGSGAYAALLDQLAVAGGAPRDTTPRYYRVDDTTAFEAALTDLFSTLAAQVLVSCDVSLASVPEDPALVNVYFDDALVPFEPSNGWSWTGADTLTVHGSACAQLLDGGVDSLQVYVGCPSMSR